MSANHREMNLSFTTLARNVGQALGNLIAYIVFLIVYFFVFIVFRSDLDIPG